MPPTKLFLVTLLTSLVAFSRSETDLICMYTYIIRDCSQCRLSSRYKETQEPTQPSLSASQVTKVNNRRCICFVRYLRLHRFPHALHSIFRRTATANGENLIHAVSAFSGAYFYPSRQEFIVFSRKSLFKYLGVSLFRKSGTPRPAYFYLR